MRGIYTQAQIFSFAPSFPCVPFFLLKNKNKQTKKQKTPILIKDKLSGDLNISDGKLSGDLNISDGKLSIIL